jgi:hypothetical protein
MKLSQSAVARWMPLAAVLFAVAAPMPAQRIVKPRRGVRIVVVKPYFNPRWEAANLTGSIVGNLIGQWLTRPRGPSEFDNWDTKAEPNTDVFVPLYREPRIDPIATYTIGSNQPDSEVLVDSKPRGFAPLTLNLESGPRYVVVRRSGFEDWKKEVETKPGDAVTVSADLKKIPEESSVIVVRR